MRNSRQQGRCHCSCDWEHRSCAFAAATFIEAASLDIPGRCLTEGNSFSDSHGAGKQANHHAIGTASSVNLASACSSPRSSPACCALRFGRTCCSHTAASGRYRDPRPRPPVSRAGWESRVPHPPPPPWQTVWESWVPHPHHPLLADRVGRYKVAVVIPARNEANVIGRAVTSLLHQNPHPLAKSRREAWGMHVFLDLHVFVVDDNSTDGTADAARRGAGTDADRLTVIPGTPFHPAGLASYGRYSRASSRQRNSNPILSCSPTPTSSMTLTMWDA